MGQQFLLEVEGGSEAELEVGILRGGGNLGLRVVQGQGAQVVRKAVVCTHHDALCPVLGVAHHAVAVVEEFAGREAFGQVEVLVGLGERLHAVEGIDGGRLALVVLGQQVPPLLEHLDGKRLYHNGIHLHDGMKMTYLFDAKYRIGGKEKGVDVPPDDAINQMHRYRDAIYYKDYDSDQLKKEVIGGYILFPGNGEPTEVAKSKFYKSINEVNIGAFPLRPKDEQNRMFLEEFIDSLIKRNTSETIAEVIPHKGTVLEVHDRVLIGLVRPSSRKDYNKNFEESKADLYYTGANFPTTISLDGLHFFIPYFKEQGIRDVYKITRIRTITGKEAKGDEGSDTNTSDLRLGFELKFSHKLADDFIKISTKGMIKDCFFNITFDKIEKLKE